MKKVYLILFSFLILFAFSCKENSTDPEQQTKVTEVVMKADFQKAELGKKAFLKSLDVPGQPEGSDLDGDGGVVRYITPSVFKVAFKSLYLEKDDNSKVYLIPDVGMLKNSEVLDLTNPVVLNNITIEDGHYKFAKGEVYYYEIKMPINIPSKEQRIRIYLSDDDFPSEGNLGHHQGDICFVDEQGNELGWVKGGEKWDAGNLLSMRSNVCNGAGGIDPETGHSRGLYGNSAMWNAPLYTQGTSQDIMIGMSEIDLTIESSSRISIEFVFNVKNTWFYEDFDPVGKPGHGLFNPAIGEGIVKQGYNNGERMRDAAWYDHTTNESAEWTPLFFTPEMKVVNIK